MRSQIQRRVWLLFLGASPALAAFNDFAFAGNGGNNTAVRKCGNMPYGCDPPNMCSKDTLTGKWYCCAPGSSDSVCWTGSPPCDGDKPLTPSTLQIPCVGGTTKYCCLKDAERCTILTGQYNICWSNLDNALRPLNASALNETFKSLSKARPSAVSYTVDRAALDKMTSTTPGATSATTTSASTTGASSTSRASTTPTTSSSPTSAPSPSGISGGAIGGIVAGVVLVLLAAAAGFFFWRRRRNNTYGKVDANPYQGYGYQPPMDNQAPYTPQPVVAEVESYPMTQPPPKDTYAYVQQQQPVEVPAYYAPVEMDGGSYRQPQHVVPR